MVKFKVGDCVKCTKFDHHSNFTYGKLYKVVEVYPDDTLLVNNDARLLERCSSSLFIRPEVAVTSQTKALPEKATDRKHFPIATGVLDYFPDAIVAIAEVSWKGNAQHNPGQPLHWAREKSTDHPDCLLRHFIERGTIDADGMRHSAKVAWRALAILQLEIEAERALGKKQV